MVEHCHESAISAEGWLVLGDTERAAETKNWGSMPLPAKNHM